MPANSDGAAQTSLAAQTAIGGLAAPSPIDQLAELQVRRKFYIAAANRQANAAKALMRRYLGWRYDAEESERDKVNEAAARIVADALDGKVSGTAVPDLLVVRDTIEPMRQARATVEADMKRLVRTLPVHAWAKTVAGFGDLGVAVLLGEAGDLAGYPKKGHLWKRLGLAPFQGKAYSTWRREGGLTAEDWVAAGYSPRRRAEMFAVIAEPLLRHQTMTAGPYRAIYDQRRAATAVTHPDWSKGHSHADAMRIMTKRLVRDAWVEYRRAKHDAPAMATKRLPAGRRAVVEARESADQDLPAGTASESAT